MQRLDLAKSEAWQAGYAQGLKRAKHPRAEYALPEYGEAGLGFTLAGLPLTNGDRRIAALLTHALGSDHPAIDDLVALFFAARGRAALASSAPRPRPQSSAEVEAPEAPEATEATELVTGAVEALARARCHSREPSGTRPDQHCPDPMCPIVGGCIQKPKQSRQPWPHGLEQMVSEIERLRRDCAEAYQVLGSISTKPCTHTDRDVERALDNLCAAAEGKPRPHEDLLPWPEVHLARVRAVTPMDEEDTVEPSAHEPRVTDAPEAVWLVYGDLERDATHRECCESGEVTWCEDAQFAADVRYLRADLLHHQAVHRLEPEHGRRDERRPDHSAVHRVRAGLGL
jgi:hypothetical protein